MNQDDERLQQVELQLARITERMDHLIAVGEQGDRTARRQLDVITERLVHFADNVTATRAHLDLHSERMSAIERTHDRFKWVLIGGMAGTSTGSSLLTIAIQSLSAA